MPIETATNVMELNPAWPLGADGKDEGDDHLRLIKTVIQALFPIGSVVTNTTGTNPGTYIGGTWEAYAPGRALVGVGDNGEVTWAIDEERGAETHTMTVDEIPSHAHWVDPPATLTDSQGSHDHQTMPDQLNGGGSYFGGGVAGDGSLENGSHRRTDFAGAHQHWVDIAGFNSGAVGGSLAHNNVQPSKAVYHWHRTA